MVTRSTAITQCGGISHGTAFLFNDMWQGLDYGPFGGSNIWWVEAGESFCDNIDNDRKWVWAVNEPGEDGYTEVAWAFNVSSGTRTWKIQT